MPNLKVDPKLQPTVVSALYEYAKLLRTDVEHMQGRVSGEKERLAEQIKDFGDRADKLDALAVELENS